MRVNKNLLLLKSNEELEDYLKPNKGYVTDAIEYAVEILNDRGYVFSEEQTSYISVALRPEEKKEVHKDYIIASNLIFASAAVGAINFLINSATAADFSIFTGILSLLFAAGLGLLARAGVPWMKYVMLVLSMIGLFALLLIMVFTYNYQTLLASTFMQTILQIVAVVFLFKAPTEKPKMKDIFEA